MPKSTLILIAAWVIICVLVTGVSGEAMTVAHGDDFSFSVDDIPSNQSASPRAWLFGNLDSMYSIDTTLYNGYYTVNIPDEQIDALDVGSYTLYIQFPGNNGLFDIDYVNNTLISVYRAIPSVDTHGFQPSMVKATFDEMSAKRPYDDVVIRHTVFVEEPYLKVLNMFTKENGDLHLDLTTNLREGSDIYAIIDEELYTTKEMIAMMSVKTKVYGTNTHRLSLDFPYTIAEQLVSGHHVIYIHFQKEGVTTIPFERWLDTVIPTPAPTYKAYYNFNGEMIGYEVNITRPYVATPTQTLPPVFETVLVQSRVNKNNRTIEQRGTVYIGEKNLDVLGTLGWRSDYKNDYLYLLRYCDSYTEDINSADIIPVKDPRHFFVDPEIFGDRIGGWCQYKAGLEEDDPPVAFFVEQAYGVYNFTTNQLENPLLTFDVKNSSFANTTTASADELNVTITMVPTTAATPIPVPTTEAIVVALPWWIGILAVVGVVLWKK
jgi:hypothetical protein